MIRKAETNDIGKIVALEEELFPDEPWKASDFQYELEENPYCTFLLYEDEGEVKGYLDLWITFEQSQVANLGVQKKSQGTGIARALLSHAEDLAVKAGCEVMSLEVRTGNSRAIELYEKNGFINAALRRHYYKNGEDAYLMIKPLGGLNT